MNTCDSFAQPRLNWLLIEDDHNDQALFALAVEKTGLSVWVQTASDGQHAIEYLLGNGAYADRQLHPLPQLIVLDLTMPRADGLDFLAWRASVPRISRIPAVLFTDSFDQELLAKARALGAAQHVFKPFEFRDWQPALRKIWSVAQTFSGSCLRANALGSHSFVPPVPAPADAQATLW